MFLHFLNPEFDIFVLCWIIGRPKKIDVTGSSNTSVNGTISGFETFLSSHLCLLDAHVNAHIDKYHYFMLRCLLYFPLLLGQYAPQPFVNTLLPVYNSLKPTPYNHHFTIPVTPNNMASILNRGKYIKCFYKPMFS